MKIIQIIPSLSYGDAVGNDAIAIKSVIEEMGYNTDIYANYIGQNVSENTAKLLRKLPRLDKYDVAILHLSTGAEINNQFADFRCRKIIRYHNITPPCFFEGTDYFTYRINSLALSSLNYLSDKVDSCLADSKFNERELMKQGYKCQIEVLPVLIPFKEYERTPDDEIIKNYRNKKVLLFVGRIVPNKKIEDVIRAFYVLKQSSNPDAVLILVGSYDKENLYYMKLKRYIDALGVRDVIFTGHISFEKILAYYSVADIFLCQSEHEGFCVPLVEAMYFKVPIVAFNSTVIPETLGNAGILLDTKDPSVTAGVIDQILKNTSIRTQIIDLQTRRLKYFDFNKAKQSLKNYINSFVHTM